MRKVLFTPAGSGMAITGIKALNNQKNVKTYSTDIDKLSPGLHLSDKGFIVPKFDEPDYMDSIFEIVEENNIDIIIPSLDPILKQFADQKHRFKKQNTEVMVSPPETIEITQDKWKTYQELNSSIEVAESWIKKDNLPDLSEPIFLKPRKGSGSKGARKIEKHDELDFYWTKTQDPIIQEYLPGSEYTVDCISGKKDNILACVPRKRIETTGGISTKIEVVKNQKLERMAEKIVESLDFTGPFFFQAKEDKHGNPKLIEIGARTAGTMCPEFTDPSLHYVGIKQILGETVPEIQEHYGKMTRYFEEISLREKDLERITDLT